MNNYKQIPSMLNPLIFGQYNIIHILLI